MVRGSSLMRGDLPFIPEKSGSTDTIDYVTTDQFGTAATSTRTVPIDHATVLSIDSRRPPNARSMVLPIIFSMAGITVASVWPSYGLPGSAAMWAMNWPLSLHEIYLAAESDVGLIAAGNDPRVDREFVASDRRPVRYAYILGSVASKQNGQDIQASCAAGASVR